MPAAIPIDHEAVRVVAVQIGVREAARQFGLPEDAVRQWSHREEWFERKQQEEQSVAVAMQRKFENHPVSQSVTGRSAAEILRDFSGQTRLSHAKVARKVANSLCEKDPDELILNMPNVLGAAKHAALTFGWTSGSPTTSVRLDLLAGTLQVDQQTPSDDLDIPE